MKTKLLKKIRAKHPIYFNSEMNKYKYRAGNGMSVSGSYELVYTYESNWVDDYKSLLNKRRDLIIADSLDYFNRSVLCYKRKRYPTQYVVF